MVCLRTSGAPVAQLAFRARPPGCKNVNFYVVYMYQRKQWELPTRCIPPSNSLHPPVS